MALFHIMALDKAGATDIRMANRPAHLDWAKASGDMVKLAGPLFAEDGTSFKGSVFIVEAADEAAVRDWQKNDPYVAAGLFQSVSISPFKWVIGAP